MEQEETWLREGFLTHFQSFSIAEIKDFDHIS